MDFIDYYNENFGREYDGVEIKSSTDVLFAYRCTWKVDSGCCLASEDITAEYAYRKQGSNLIAVLLLGWLNQYVKTYSVREKEFTNDLKNACRRFLRSYGCDAPTWHTRHHHSFPYEYLKMSVSGNESEEEIIKASAKDIKHIIEVAEIVGKYSIWW